MDDERRRATLRAAAMGSVLALLVAGALGYDAFLQSIDAGPQPEVVSVDPRPEPPAFPSGETIEVPTQAEPAVARGPENAPVRPVEPRIPREHFDGEPSGSATLAAALPPHVVTPEPEVIVPEVSGVALASEATDTIPGIGRPLFGRRSTRLTDSAEYESGLKTGIIRDYSDMWSRGGCDWAAVAEGVQLADYAVSVSPFRNLTEVENARVRFWLEESLQEELDGIAGDAGRVSTENAIFLASDGPDAAIGIEMIFRDSSGRVVAKIRHTIHEDSAADAAEEMVEAVTDFIEDHEVVSRGK